MSNRRAISEVFEFNNVNTGSAPVDSFLERPLLLG
jgi:hypothetical protein